MSIIDHGNGYRYITLIKNGKSKNNYVHRLVAQAFLKNPHLYKVVNHKDSIRANNNVENLEWCTHSYNIQYSIDKYKAPKSISSSVLGKGIRYKGNRYEVGICHRYGGRYDNLFSAEKARDKIVKEYYG